MNLEDLIKLLPTIQDLMPLDNAIVLSDKERILHYLRGKSMDLKGVTVGEKVT